MRQSATDHTRLRLLGDSLNDTKGESRERLLRLIDDAATPAVASSLPIPTTLQYTNSQAGGWGSSS